MDPKLAEQAEVHVTHVPGGPPGEEVLAVRLVTIEHGAVDERGVRLEAPLRAGHPHGASADEAAVIVRDSVDRVAFGHGVSTLRSALR